MSQRSKLKKVFLWLVLLATSPLISHAQNTDVQAKGDATQDNPASFKANIIKINLESFLALGLSLTYERVITNRFTFVVQGGHNRAGIKSDNSIYKWDPKGDATVAHYKLRVYTISPEIRYYTGFGKAENTDKIAPNGVYVGAWTRYRLYRLTEELFYPDPTKNFINDINLHVPQVGLTVGAQFVGKKGLAVDGFLAFGAGFPSITGTGYDRDRVKDIPFVPNPEGVKFVFRQGLLFGFGF